MRDRSIRLLLLAAIVAPCSSWAEAGKAGNAVTVVGGALVRNAGAAKPALRELKSGDALAQGDIINTGSKGQVKVLLADKSIIDLGPTTLFKVDEFRLKNVEDREVALSVDYGKIRGNVPEKIGKKGKFRIQTKTATMGVRGTEFIVLSDLVGLPEIEQGGGGDRGGGGDAGGGDDTSSKNETKIVVVEGTVEVETEERKEESHTITTGQQLVATEDEEDEDKPQEEQGAAEGEGDVNVEVTSLTQDEVNDVKEEVQIEDQTFEEQVVVDQTNTGDDTLAAFEDSFSLPEDFVPGVQDFGTPGLFGPDVGFGGSYYPGLVGDTVKVTVVFQP